MENFWDFSVWGMINLIAVLLVSLLAANILRRTVPFLRASLIPTSVLGGLLLVLADWAYRLFAGSALFDSPFFGGNGTAVLELLTYHCLALGFIASAFRPSRGRLTRARAAEIFNTGVTTVSTYLLQGILGLAVSVAAAFFVKDFFPAAGILLPFGYGQGTGQALNYGGIFEADYGFSAGKSFGLTIAALGFLSASLGGVIHLNVLRKRGMIRPEPPRARAEQPGSAIPEEPMKDSVDRLTIQIAFIFGAYLLAWLLMFALGQALPKMKSVIYGFNFLLGVLSATAVKALLNLLKKKGLVRKEYMDRFLMTRTGNFFFDLMIVAGIAAIRFHVLQNYWGIILIMAVSGMILTYLYNSFVARVLFPDYREEQFLAMYGMLTGTASTGVILLRELDGDFRTPAADNLVYQNFPAIAFGFPMMLLATLAPVRPVLTLLILILFFIVMNLILFRSRIFARKEKKTGPEP